MAQHWHGHWIEDTFKATRLQNWEVPKWYPARPDKHCVPTRIVANDRGHILSASNRSKGSPWGNFKGTWDLPKKITRAMAQEMSAPLKHRQKFWELHAKKNREMCKKPKGFSGVRKRGGAEKPMDGVAEKVDEESEPKLGTTQNDGEETAAKGLNEGDATTEGKELQRIENKEETCSGKNE